MPADKLYLEDFWDIWKTLVVQNTFNILAIYIA